MITAMIASKCVTMKRNCFLLKEQPFLISTMCHVLRLLLTDLNLEKLLSVDEVVEGTIIIIILIRIKTFGYSSLPLNSKLKYLFYVINILRSDCN
jgi:hypothetical protein